MAGNKTFKMIAAFFQIAPAPLFLSGFFRSTPDSFHNSEFVSIDIERAGEQIATVLKDPCTGYNINDASIFTNKEFKPPILAEQMDFEACSLLPREPGVNPYADQEFQAKATSKVLRGTSKLVPLFRRTQELQASTILQTGKCSLPGADGTIQYELDYQPKASHFPTVVTAWDDPLSTKQEDIEAVATLNRKDGKRRSNILIFGKDAKREWINDPKIQKLLDNRKINIGEISPVERAEDATFFGMIWIGEYQYEQWSYDGYYEDPATGDLREFIDPAKVIVMSDKARLEASFGAVPRFAPSDADALSFMPNILQSAEALLGLFLNVWMSTNKETLSAGIKSRPLLIPVEIDSISCINTGL